MPELPDVEHHRRTAARHGAGRAVQRVHVPDPGLLSGTTPAGLGRSLTGRRLDEPRRWGKWLLLPTDEGAGPTLVVHFRMSGELAFALQGERDPADAVVLRLAEGDLVYRSRRRLGGVAYLRPGRDPETVTGPLGPDAAELDGSTLAAALAGRRGSLKATLLDQRRVAGLGNELVDELCWRARLAPDHPAGDLSEGELDRLSSHLHDVLRAAVAAGRVPDAPEWLTSQRGADDPRCPRCERPLRRERIGSRTTLWCPHDQRRRDAA